MIDDRLRSAAREVRVAMHRELPPPLPVERHRGGTVAAFALIIVALVVGGGVYSMRQDEPSVASDEPAPSTADIGATATTTMPTTSLPPSETTGSTGTSGRIEQVTPLELSAFIGTYTIDYQDANVTLGQVGTSELRLEMTPHSFCLRFTATSSSGCRYSTDGSTMPTQPETLVTDIGSSEIDTAAPLISLDMVVPDGVELQVLDGDQSACALQRFPLTQFGTAVVWACQARGTANNWEIAATKDGRTLAAAILPSSSSVSTDTTNASSPLADVPYVAVGETVMLGAKPILEDSGIRTFAEVSKSASWEIDELRMARSSYRISGGVVIQLGTNGTVTRQEYESILAEVSDLPRVVVLTVRAPKSWIAANNEIIRSLPLTHPNVVVLDWEARSAEVADHLSSSDGGVHLADDVSKQFFTNLILEALGLPTS
jgi:hypothetical protein